MLGSLRVWQRAYDQRKLTPSRRLYRWEYVSCAMLAPSEAALFVVLWMEQGAEVGGGGGAAEA